MTTPTCRSAESVGSLRTHKRFLQTPIDLFLNHRPRTEPALYAGIARLCEIARGPVEVSRADLAHWCGAEREDATGVAIEQAIWRLRAGGWLIQTPGEGRKRRLLVAWGFGMDGQPRPWRFDRPDRGRPSSTQAVAIPLALFDGYLGRLRLDPIAPAQIDRYFSQPLLTFDDIGVYAARRLGNVPATPRLAQLGLINDHGCVDPPSLDELREQAAAGTLTTCADDGTIIAVMPAEQPRRRRATKPQSSFDAPDGSGRDPEQSFDGSGDRSIDSKPHLALERGAAPVLHSSGAAWDQDGNNKLIKQKNPPPTESYSAHAKLGEGDQPTPRMSREPSTGQPTDLGTPPAIEKQGGGSEINHKSEQLDPMIATLHQTLNTDRDISPAEWQGLFALQRQYSRDRLLGWQLRAVSAGRCEIRLGYYMACAADEAFATAGAHPRRPVSALDDPPDARLAAEPAPRPSRRGASSAPVPAQQLDRSRGMVLAGIELLLGEKARYPEKLAGVPLALLTRWRAIAGHPGLQKYDDPMAYVIELATAGKEPPSITVLNAWAEQAGVNWYDPRLAAWRNTVEEWDKGEGGDDLAVLDTRTASCTDPANKLRSSDLDDQDGQWEDLPCSLEGQTDPAAASALTLATNDEGDVSASWAQGGTDLLAALREELRLIVPLAQWEVYAWLCDGLEVRSNATHIDLACGSREHYSVAREVQGVLRDALADLGLPDTLQFVPPDKAAPPESTRPGGSGGPASDVQPAAVVAPVHPPPDWIDPASWAELDPDLRAALAGSELAPDGGLNVRADVYDLLVSRFAGPLRGLLAAAWPGAAPEQAQARGGP